MLLDECACASIDGTANVFTARGKTKSLFDLRFDVAFVATVRIAEIVEVLGINGSVVL